MHLYSFARDATINSLSLKKKSLIFLFHLHRFSPLVLKVAFSIAWVLHFCSELKIKFFEPRCIDESIFPCVHRCTALFSSHPKWDLTIAQTCTLYRPVSAGPTKCCSCSNCLNPYSSPGGASLVAQMVKNLPASAGDPGAIPGSGRFLAGGHGHPLQYSCLENPMDRGAWWAIVASGVPKELDTTEWLTLSHFQSSPRNQGIVFCPFL